MDELILRGFGFLRAYEAGVIEHYLNQGYTLREAQMMAFNEGLLRFKGSFSNLVVNDGLEIAIDLLTEDEGTGLTYCEIGTGTTTPAAGDEDLVTGAARKAWLSRDRSSQTGNFATFFTAAESTYHIRELGNFGGASATSTLGSGKLFSRWLYNYDNSGGNNDLTIDYSITAQAA